MKSFGAVGDGVADDTSAVAAALAASPTVHFPRGSYKVSTFPTLVDRSRLTGDGFESELVYTGTGTMLTLAGKQDVGIDSMSVHLEAIGAVAFDLDASFQCFLDTVRVRGNHSDVTVTDYQTQKGLILRGNTGNTRIHNCVFANLGIGIDVSCIQNEVTNSRFTNCATSIAGTGTGGNAGMIVAATEFVGSGGPVFSTGAHVEIVGPANSWVFSSSWFEGSEYGLIVGDATGGPSQFSMVGCKVAARGVGIQFNYCRQPSLISCVFDEDQGGVMTEIVFDSGGDNAIEGVALNLVTTIRGDFADSDFPQYWNVMRKGSLRTPNFRSSSDVFVDGTVDTGNLKVRNGGPAVGEVLTAEDTDGNAGWAPPFTVITQAAYTALGTGRPLKLYAIVG
ncbi:glycosyl hydrolase family 28-related protein [Nocardia salmonicida]|uniref:glycosyl hydrolase family 28-related protein n=1 Tax=Nocardia salmonicida TaxID=53431 RepID=UPI0034065444